MPLLTLTDDNFDEMIKDGVTLVDFWAPWCGPCQMMGPIVDEIAKEFAGKAKVGKINVDESGATASQYGIMSIPAFKIFKDGVEVSELIGGVGKERLVDALNAAL